MFEESLLARKEIWRQHWDQILQTQALMNQQGIILVKLVEGPDKRQESIGGKLNWNASSNSAHVACLECLLDDMIPKKSDLKFLDIGCGTGFVVMTVAKHGVQSYGIDFYPHCFQVAKDNITLAEKTGFIPQGKAKVAFGNFFPPEFPINHGNSVWENRSNRLIDDARKIDPYIALGIKSEDIDLFYHYQMEWSRNLLGFFSTYARSGARFVIVHSFPESEDPLDLPKNVRILATFDHTVALYEKN